MGYYVFNPFTKKMDWTEAGGGGGPSFASIWTSQLSFGSATGGSMFASTVSFSSITVSECNLNKNTWNYRNLTIAPNISFASAKIDINADAMLLTNASGYTIYSSTVDLTVTISVSGISGLMGSAEASSQWYHIWGVSEGVNFTAILDSSPTAPTLPAGYTYKCYLGAAYNGPSGNFVTFKQYDNRVNINMTQALTGGVQTTVTAINLATMIPSTAKVVYSHAGVAGAVSYVALTLYSDSGGTTTVQQFQLQASGAAATLSEADAYAVLQVAQTLYYKAYAGMGAGYMHVIGWEY